MDGGEAEAAGRWWGHAATSSATSASTDVMNQLCRVCGEPAAGFHFGAFTCEGCKSFFGRTYNNLGSITECKNNGECVINKKNRTSCKACRLRKCLLVGMSKSGSRYGRRSNWFKIHCLLQEQQQQQQQQHLQLQHGVAQSREQAQAKGKVLPMWDALGQAFPIVDKPPQQVDADNNNLGSPKAAYLDAKARVTSPNHHHHHHPMLQVRSHPSYGEAAAALWAARSTLLPIHPHHGHPMGPSPLASLSVPFLASPFLHGAAFPQPAPRGFVIPFAQTQRLQASPGQLVAASATTNTSASSSCGSCSSSPPVTPEASGQDKDSSGGEDTPVAVLRALGPIQEQPMDLSMRGASSRSSAACPEGACSGEGGQTADVAGCASGRSRDSEERRPTTVPLDLSVTLQNR